MLQHFFLLIAPAQQIHSHVNISSSSPSSSSPELLVSPFIHNKK
jgi:hypothetical protein